MGPVDIETVSAIERITERIDTLETTVRGDIAQLGMRVSHLDLRAEIRDGLAEARRHAAILNESTRDDIRLVAEAVAALTVKVESLRR